MNANPIHQLLGISENRVDIFYNKLVEGEKERIASGIPHSWGVSDENAMLALEMFSWNRIKYSTDKEHLQHIVDFMVDLGV